MPTKQLKLTIDLVPSSCWYKSLRKSIPASQWKKIRMKVYEDQQNVCGICGADGRLNCHELWAYDDKKHVQKLMGFQAICTSCHLVNHFGMAGVLEQQGYIDIENIIQHFLDVNGVPRRTFDRHKTEAFALWRSRSKHKWKTDLGKWAALVKK